MRISLPSSIELTCPACGGKVVIALHALSGKGELNCAFCRDKYTILDAMPAKLRRKVYYALRDSLEQSVYLQYRKLHGDHFDEWSEHAWRDIADPEAEK